MYGSAFLAKTVYSKYCSRHCSEAAYRAKKREEKKEQQSGITIEVSPEQ
jgi:hypothetical protein